MIIQTHQKIMAINYRDWNWKNVGLSCAFCGFLKLYCIIELFVVQFAG